MPPDDSPSLIIQVLFWLFCPGFLLICAASLVLTLIRTPKEKKNARMWYVFLIAGLIANVVILTMLQVGFFRQFALP
jgi:hypothetical protein